ncbi:hypothetical protein CNMCM5793_000734 [Aspergillus hiratsukae]|uniref:Uncharacterized protein n=1 Tax=Aspergillus hiratsukae TaxID=1194566 RepID=A0A8H6P0R2_9EURO|nr:hypothetical protein CNMCM5793_000734 [Aspergillus hiratsukae]
MCFGLSDRDDERYAPPRRTNPLGYNHSRVENSYLIHGYDNSKHRNGRKKRRHYGHSAGTAAAGNFALFGGGGGGGGGCGGGGGGC